MAKTIAVLLVTLILIGLEFLVIWGVLVALNYLGIIAGYTGASICAVWFLSIVLVAFIKSTRKG